MDSDSIIIIFTMMFLLLISAYFSATETAFSSLNRIRLKNIANSGNKRAKLALLLLENYDALLSTILIGNNLVNITSASISTIIFTKYYGSNGITISTIVITILVLIFGEITPKSLAKENPERFAMFSAPILKLFMIILKPFNLLFMLWKRILSKIFKVKDDRSITEEELLTIVDEAQNEGGINEEEGELIRSAIEFNDLDVNDVLTPRVDLISIDINYSNEEIDRLFYESGYSRIPVYENSIDNIIGVIHEKNFHRYLKGDDKNIRNTINPVIWATPTMKISKLLKLLQKTNSHMAIISDEYGGTLGIVTLEDILEELVGEIWDEHDEVIEEVIEIGEGVYKISCNANIDKIFNFFDINREYPSNTVSGFVIGELGRMPKEGDSFVYDNLQIVVTKTDSRRVLEIEVTIIEDEKEE